MISPIFSIQLREFVSFRFALPVICLLLLFTGLFETSPSAHEAVQEMWVARYNSAIGSQEMDPPQRITVDGSGNVYVAQVRGIAVKYDSEGNQLWVYHDGDVRVDVWGNIYVIGSDLVKYDSDWNELWVASYPLAYYCTAFAVDDSGNVYFTGQGGDDYVTIKYDNAGNQQWVARYDGPASGGDTPTKILVDLEGNVYVTGSSEGDFATVKYNSRGKQLWVARYDRPLSGLGNSADHAKDLLVDGGGNVYVAGLTQGTDTYGRRHYDFTTIKYGKNGNQLWVAHYDASEADDRLNGMAVDAWGNVYVAGSSKGTYIDYDYATVKYDSDGNQLWVARYEGLPNGNDEVCGMALDPSGNVYVAGDSDLFTTDLDYAIVKYDSEGNQLWVARYDRPAFSSDDAWAFALDEDGNVYVTGRSRGDYTTVKYDTTGNHLWSAFYSSNILVSDEDRPGDLAVDIHGEVFVTGTSNGVVTDNDFVTLKYDTEGTEVWVAHYDGGIQGPDQARSIALDKEGNVYVTGRSAGFDTSYDYATVKYDNAGNQLWVARYDGPASGPDEASALTLDNEGNVYVTGKSVGFDTGYDYATVKYDSEGNQLWVARYDGGFNYWDEAKAIALSIEGNVFITGSSSGDYATVKYDSEGNQLWVARYDGPASRLDEAYALVIDNEGNVCITGKSTGIGTYNDYATVKYDNEGHELWVARYAGPYHDNAYAIAVDGAGNIIVTGLGDFYASFWPYIVTIKYDGRGNQLWVARYEDQPVGMALSPLTLDAVGNVYVAGMGTNIVDADTAYDYATVKYDKAGNQLWVAGYDGRKDQFNMDAAIAIDLDVSGNVYVTGESIGEDWDIATIKYRVITPAKVIDELLWTLQTMKLDQGIENSLVVKLEAAQASLESEKTKQDSINKLQAFINEVEAHRGGAITNEQAEILIQMALEAISLI